MPRIPNFTYNIKSAKTSNKMVRPYDFKPLCLDYEVLYTSRLNYALSPEGQKKMVNETLPDFISFNSTFPDQLNWTIYTKDISYEKWLFNISTIITVNDASSNLENLNTTNDQFSWILSMIYIPYYPPNKPPVILVKTH